MLSARSVLVPALLIFAAAAGVPSAAQEPPAAPPATSEEAAGAVKTAPADASDLKALSIEELMNVEVTSVSKRGEPLSGAAAAITVLTQEEIRRSGATSLPEVLRLVPGLAVARFDSRTWAISARGFNITTANKLLVLIDGRSIYTPLFSGVFWDAQDVFLPDVERIEVIRGPGATLWGANAVNGVINIITKRARDTPGGLAYLAAGNEDVGVGAVRYGGELKSGTYYRTYLKYSYRDSLDFADGRDAQDPLRKGQGGFRVDRDGAPGNGLTVQGDLYSGLIGQSIRDDSEISGGNLIGHWSRRLGEGSDLKVEAYYDRTHRRVPEQFEEHRDTFDLDVQHRLQRRHNDFLWGVGYRATADRVVSTPVFSFEPDRRTLGLLSAYAQDEVPLLGDRLHLTFGSKFEVNDYSGFEVQPSVRLAWSTSPRETFWSAVSRAVRTPTRLDRDVRFITGPVVVLQGGDDFRSEDVLAYELGWRRQIGAALSFDLAAYHNVYDDLRSQEPAPGGGLPITLGNGLNADTSGLELSMNYQMTPRWRWQGGWTWFDKDLSLDPESRDPSRGLGEGNDFNHQFELRSSVDLAHGVELDAWLRHVGSLPSPAVPAYTELDLRLGWHQRPGIEISLGGQNLLHERHVEFGGPVNAEAVERSVYGKVAWHF